ncbi:acyl-CoA dehydrogenase family protein [Catenulispora pinisilvae]|uniref:acyl-CoA dehydrogenase family protein n=1 Tax=Catenulispora pinisilvae TaxID=2705253 RepID=UPI0018922BF4|nr:acyl-CoA dehydrogenase [Catenulispora pinisilvae]
MTSDTGLRPAPPAGPDRDSDHDRDRDSADLTRLLYDGTYAGVHEDIRALLFDPIFDHRRDLTSNEAGRLAYRRGRFVHGRLERPADVLRDPRRLFALTEWTTLLDISTFPVLAVHYNLCFGTLIEHSAGRDDVADYIEELDSLSSFGPYMATELGYGNNVAALRTEAVYDNETNTFVLNTPDVPAQKHMPYSGFTDIPKLAVVMARLKSAGQDYGVFPFMVRISGSDGPAEGVRAALCPEKPAMGLDNGLTWFDHVRIPRRSLLTGDLGEFTEDGVFHPSVANPRKRFLRAMSRNQPGRICVSAASVSLGRASVYIALRYALQRVTNAPGRNDMPVIEYRSHQLPLFTALAKVYAMTFLVNRTKREYVARRGVVDTDLSNLISITKALTTWEMSDVAAVCRERCGAQGMFSVNRIVDYGIFLQSAVTAEGDSQVLLAATAGQEIARSGGELTPQTPDPRGRDIRDPALQLECIRYRAHWLRQAVREAMHADRREPYFDSWNRNVNDALAMARLEGVAAALECALAAADDARTTAVSQALRLLAALYGLHEIQRDAGWYLARGALDAAQVEAIPAAADGLCETLRPQIPMLIDGFQLSPQLLRAPIAADDYVTAYNELTGPGQPEPIEEGAE